MGDSGYDKLLDRIDEREVVQLLSELMRFQTVNPPGNERGMAEYSARWLADAGLEVEVLNHDQERASLIARLKGSGEVPAVAYTGHLDVVPLGEAQWSHDPFGGKVSEGKVWGRGATDMKSGDAVMMIVAKMLAAAKVPLKGDLILALTAGEEVDFLGSRAIADGWHWGPAQIVFMLEPSGNEVVVAEKGILWLEITTYGKTAHISQIEQGRNAIMMMLPILTELDKMPVEYAEHPLLGGFARSINTVHAGAKTNTIPDRCVATVDMRSVPGQEHDKIVAQVEKLIADVGQRCALPDFNASVKVIHNGPPLANRPQDETVKRFCDIVAEVTGKQPQPIGAGGATDAIAFVPRLQAPFCMCGPGTPKMIHQTDEYVEIPMLVDSTRIYLLTALRFLT